MKILMIITMLTFGFVAMAQEPDAKQLDKLARQFGQAWLTADVHTLDHLLSREYMHTDVTGKVLHRADWLADAANVQKWLRAPEGDAKPSIEFEDMTVKLIGDTAVLLVVTSSIAPTLKQRPSNSGLCNYGSKKMASGNDVSLRQPLYSSRRGSVLWPSTGI